MCDRWHCGSRSIANGRCRACPIAASRLSAVVVLPTPPFWLNTAMIATKRRITRAAAATPPEATIAPGGQGRRVARTGAYGRAAAGIADNSRGTRSTIAPGAGGENTTQRTSAAENGTERFHGANTSSRASGQ